MKNSQPFNSLPDNREGFILAHLRNERPKRRAQFHQEPFPWLAVAILIVIAVATAIGVVELILN